MRRHWLAREGGSELTLVFGGWALGPAPFALLSGSGDVLVVDDFRDLADELSETSSYDQVRLLAYSFGVASAAHWLASVPLKPSQLVAVNGTLFPADVERGISPETVEATADGLTSASFARFCRRAGLNGTPPALDIAAAQDELRVIDQRGKAPDTQFDRIWIAKRDRIIPTKSQETAWHAQAERVRLIDASHQPFLAGQSWKEWFA
ncbi:pimeloyl-ACP methyl esterase BioG family protein [Roseibium sp. RKSG952]|uniref:pimeloyl-ACP methyl esterase BioG family protein n=1 Tax=Roseibium sp. RKSG952 TaxID=2529384 RepID=UPI0012BC7B5F|nr:pimeloyl-ACP methyl esterase BioG family protein [Roseibium sp. RKSG952]MTI02278.1 DUF452 family protein [Roseibium sp. RKSG952]